MIAEAIENIKWNMNDKAYYSDFVACYARMLQVFISPFSFAIYVQRFNADESAYLSLLVIEPGTFPLFETSVYFTKGSRDKLLKYIERDSFRKELCKDMKDLMNSHHKELLKMQSD